MMCDVSVHPGPSKLANEQFVSDPESLSDDQLVSAWTSSSCRCLSQSPNVRYEVHSSMSIERQFIA